MSEFRPRLIAIMAQGLCEHDPGLNGLIGIEDEQGEQALPWYSRRDMRFYVKNTRNNIVIVGRKTYDTLPKAAFKQRTVYVVSRHITDNSIGHDNGKPALAFRSVSEAISYASMRLHHHYADTGEERKIFVAGGAQIYKQVLEQNLVDEILLTQVIIEPEITPAEPHKLIKLDCGDSFTQFGYHREMSFGVPGGDNELPLVFSHYIHEAKTRTALLMRDVFHNLITDTLTLINEACEPQEL